MKMRILGLDPGLRRTGWGVVEIDGSALSHVANGAVSSDAGAPLAARLAQLFEGVQQVMREWRPDAAAVEETFVNRNPASTLKLGQARGIALLAPALEGLDVAEYAPNRIKKAIVGTGHADKAQIRAMVSVLLPAVEFACDDAADALALAICHSHYLSADRARAAGLMRAGARA